MTKMMQMNSLNITNRQELLLEIDRLKLEVLEQTAAIHTRFKSPGAILHTAQSLFQRKNSGQQSRREDIFSLLSRVLIPFTLNRTIFSQSGFIVKTLVGLASQKAAHFVNEGSIEPMISKGKALLEKLFPKHSPHEQV